MDFVRYAVGKTIKQIRKEKCLSQEVLSGFTGLARSHLAMIEKGTKQTNFETIWRIANALQIAPHTLVNEIENNILDEKRG